MRSSASPLANATIGGGSPSLALKADDASNPPMRWRTKEALRNACFAAALEKELHHQLQSLLALFLRLDLL